MEKQESFLELLKIDVEKYPVIAVVGGGGKTSLIFQLVRELLEMGKTAVVTTTTHMAWEPQRPFALHAQPREVERLLGEYGYVVAAQLDETAGKITALPEGQLTELAALCDVLLIEADGAKQHPIKVPEAWEPAIPAIADLVISVVGLDCLGRPIRQTAHRMERTAEVLKKGLDAPMTPEDVIKIATSICGLYKNVEDRVYRVYLNKTDVLTEKESARQILRGLADRDTVAACGSLAGRDTAAACGSLAGRDTAAACGSLADRDTVAVCGSLADRDEAMGRNPAQTSQKEQEGNL